MLMVDVKYSEIEIKKMVKIRWKNLIERSFNLCISPPKYSDMEELMLENWQTGFCCSYCLRPLKLYQQRPPIAAPSYDHKIHLRGGGTNKKENMIIVCWACNLMKGTMSMESWLLELKALKTLPEEEFNKIVMERMKGHLKDKLSRNETEKKDGEKYAESFRNHLAEEERYEKWIKSPEFVELKREIENEMSEEEKHL